MTKVQLHAWVAAATVICGGLGVAQAQPEVPAYNLCGSLHAILEDGHFLAIGDSQTQDSPFSIWSYGWPHLAPVDWAGMALTPAIVDGQQRGDMHWMTGIVELSVGTDHIAASLAPAGTTGMVLRPISQGVIQIDANAGTDIGFIGLHPRPDFPWPGINAGRTWFEGRRLAGRLAYLDGNEAPLVSGLSMRLERFDATTTATTIAAPVPQSPVVGIRSAAIGGLDDPGLSNQTTRIVMSLSGPAQAQQLVVPMGGMICRVDQDGQPVAGCYLDQCGRAGTNCHDFLGPDGVEAGGSGSGASQEAWRQYLLATVVHPRAVFVPWMMITNLSPQDTSNNEVTQAWIDGQEAAMDRVLSAYQEAFPGGETHPVLCMGWTHPDSAFNLPQLCHSAEHGLLSIAQRRGWGMFSFYSAFNGLAPWYHMNIHAESHDDSDLLAQRLLDVLEHYPIAIQPAPAAAHLGDQATFRIMVALEDGGVDIRWRHNGTPLTDGPQANGSVVSGAGTPTLTVFGMTEASTGPYDAIVTSQCGTVQSSAATLGLLSRCPHSADFDGDGDTATDHDIEAFFRCLAGNCCPTCEPADFDGDGDTGTDADIETFFRAIAGNC